MSELQKPTSVKFTPEAVKALAAKEALTEGWYRFIIAEAETKIAASGHLMIGTVCLPLEDTDDPNSAFKKGRVRNNIILPIDNPDVADHKAPNTMGLCHSFLMALYPDEIQDYPRFKDGALRFNGEEIEKAEEEEYRIQVSSQVTTKLEQLWEDPSTLVDEVFYAEVFQNGDFVNLRGVSQELPDGKKLVPKGEFITKGDVTVPSKSNGMTPGAKNGAAKAAAKPVAKATNGKRK